MDTAAGNIKINFIQVCMILMLVNGLMNHVIVNPMLLDVAGRDAWISGNSRRKGYGKLAFEKLLELLHTKNIDLEVMYWNNIGYRFLKTLGFTERSLYETRGNDRKVVTLTVNEAAATHTFYYPICFTTTA